MRFIIYVLLFVVSVSGCAAIKETAKGVAGVSIKALDEGRANAIKKTFSRDYAGLYAKTLDSLKSIGAYVYARDIKKKMIAVYVSDTDTTPVGIFFQEIDKNNTQVEVSSLSPPAKEFIAGKLFLVLQGQD